MADERPWLCNECGHQRAFHCDWEADYENNRLIPHPRPCRRCGCTNTREVYDGS